MLRCVQARWQTSWLKGVADFLEVHIRPVKALSESSEAEAVVGGPMTDDCNSCMRALKPGTS